MRKTKAELEAELVEVKQLTRQIAEERDRAREQVVALSREAAKWEERFDRLLFTAYRNSQ